MLCELRQRIDDLLLAVGGDENAFNHSTEAERLGIHIRRGRIYPLAVGRSHTGRPADDLFVSRSSKIGDLEVE